MLVFVRLLATLVLLATGLPPLAPARGAPDAAPRAGVLLTPSPVRTVIGEPVRLTAQVAPARRGRKVTFQRRSGDRWSLIGTETTNRAGVASISVRFPAAGSQQVRAVAAAHGGVPRQVDGATVQIAKKPSTVVAAVPVGPWTLGRTVDTAVTVKPAAAGRQVWMERMVSGRWAVISQRVLTGSTGRAVIPWSPDRLGTSEYRVAVGANATYGAAATTQVPRTIEGGEGALVIHAPEWVVAGDVFEVVLEVRPVRSDLVDAHLTLTAPDRGGQVTPPGDVTVDPGTRTGVVHVGDVAVGQHRRVRLRWRSPSEATSLTVSGELVSQEQEATASAEIDVLTPAAGGGAFGGGLEMVRGSTFAPDHPDLVHRFCDQAPPVGVPTFAAARTAAQAYLDGVMVDAHAEDWASEPALADPRLIDQVVMVALADGRPAAALAAALKGHALAPADIVHLVNAAVAANQLRRPEWAIAFTRQAASGAPAPAIGAPQEAIRLATEGHAWALMRDWGRAQTALRDALLVDPDNPQLHAQLGTVLACSGDKSGALPYVRRGLRPDERTDPMKDDDDWPEGLRRTWLGASDLYDLSGGTENRIITPTLPAGWAELVARGRLEGNSYYKQQYDALHARTLSLATRRNQLRQQLNAQWADASPAWRQRTEDILDRISVVGDRDVREAWRGNLSYQQDVIGLNDCEQGQFPTHPFCRPDYPTDFSCGLDQAVFDEWLNRMRGWETAMNDYQAIAWPVFTGLQANLADPTAHALAGVMIEQHFLSHGVSALAQNLWITADQFTRYDQDQEDDEPPRCLTPASPGETAEADVGGDQPALCSADSIETKFSLTIDLGIMAFSFDCEKYAVEVGLGAYGFLEAFARAEQTWNTSAVTYYVGTQVGVPYVGSYESALFLETDAQGKVTDLGLESGVSVGGGYVIDVELYSDTQRVSAMSFFAAP